VSVASAKTPATGISCTATECDNGLHCYRPKKSRKEWADPPGTCQRCGDRSVDWDRVRRRDLKDTLALQAELKKEWIRNHFWIEPLDKKSVENLAKTPRIETRDRIRRELAKVVGPPRPFRDGYRVPVEGKKLEGHPIYYAQHATGACCKKCAYYWWGFPRHEQYTDGQIDFLTDMCMSFFDARGYLPKRKA
jgi:hypothetical protein